MKKILVSLEVPAISGKYDISIPDFLEVNELVPLLASAVEELSDHKYVSSGHEFLCLKEKRMLIKDDETLKSYGLKNGDHLVLI